MTSLSSSLFLSYQSDVQDIEDVVKLGRELETCPYYATRAAVAGAHLVVLPYQTLMHKSTREACGIEMRDNVVIIDEAHNLPDAICAMHSTEIAGNQVGVSTEDRHSNLDVGSS